MIVLTAASWYYFLDLSKKESSKELNILILNNFQCLLTN
ncbi:MAG: hypothetical protein Rsou_1306 [Candidatus Ruthia sp. Asou_11_S2]|nr:hypothetical protein [Candidatus Ruthia sp. Asou_11_S2]